MTATDLVARVDARPRTRLAQLPTPLIAARNLRAALGPDAPEILVKRDDLTGFGLGGNKVRKLEHELPPDRIEGLTHLITMGGPQSNHCRVTAAAAAHLGLRCILVVSGDPGEPPRGNAMLHRLLGADVRVVGGRDEREDAVAAAVRAVEREGGRALPVPLGASTPHGALGYVHAAAELVLQLDGLPEPRRPARVFLASSSAGTLGGLVAGLTLLGRSDIHLTGVSADVASDELVEGALELATGAMELLGAAGAPIRSIVSADDGQVGKGYGIPTLASREALELFARAEGTLLDPVYTAKAAAGLIGAVRAGAVGAYERAVFLHTGGHPALFA